MYPLIEGYPFDFRVQRGMENIQIMIYVFLDMYAALVHGFPIANLILLSACGTSSFLNFGVLITWSVINITNIV